MNDLCKVCGSTEIDDYGCMDCFMNAASVSWDDEEDFEEDK